MYSLRIGIHPGKTIPHMHEETCTHRIGIHPGKTIPHMHEETCTHRIGIHSGKTIPHIHEETCTHRIGIHSGKTMPHKLCVRVQNICNGYRPICTHVIWFCMCPRTKHVFTCSKGFLYTCKMFCMRTKCFVCVQRGLCKGGLYVYNMFCMRTKKYARVQNVLYGTKCYVRVQI